MLDTNLLIRLKGHAESAELAASFDQLLEAGYAPCICLQNLTEIWSIATRPISSNGFGLQTQEVATLVKQLRDGFEWLSDEPTTADIWLELCTRYAVAGRHVHDARLAATALANGVKSIATYNTSDFQAFEELEVICPRKIKKTNSEGHKEPK